MKIRVQKYYTKSLLPLDYYDILSSPKGPKRFFREIIYSIRLFLYEHFSDGKQEIEDFKKLSEKI